MALTDNISFFSDSKLKISEAQIKATLSANGQMIQMYWDSGKMIAEKQNTEGWGASAIPKLSRDLKNEMPDIKGFFERHLKFITQFYKKYQISFGIGKQSVCQFQTTNKQEVVFFQQPVTQLENNKNKFFSNAGIERNEFELLVSIPWGHHINLMQKIKNLDNRFWYIKQT